MGQRLDLHKILTEITGVANAYFQPPSNLQMNYPCIVYSRDNARSIFADNSPYRYTQRYQVTVIDRDPDSEIPKQVAMLPLCLFNRHYTADGLHHDVFSLYF